MSEKCEPVQMTLARLDERIKALNERWSIERTDRDRAIKLAADELSRRLDDLNHAHEKAQQDRAQYATRVEVRWLMGTGVVILMAIVGYLAAIK